MILGGGVFKLLFLKTSNDFIMIESLESKTITGTEVFNKIKFESQNGIDTWSMLQSHSGLHGGDWDELKIEVDTTTSPKVASYFQYKNGVEVEYRVSCFQCHANGPRAIRANYKSLFIKNTIDEKMKIFLWNLKIKHYGTIKTPQNKALTGEFRKVPLMFEGRGDKRKLNLKSCSLCHSEESLLGRTALEMQHLGTIKYLVESKQMPPFPFKISDQDKAYLRKFYQFEIN